MNIAEKLAREINRVTVIRCHYEEVGRLAPQAMVAPAIAMMDVALAQAYDAAGRGDAMVTVRALAVLEGFAE